MIENSKSLYLLLASTLVALIIGIVIGNLFVIPSPTTSKSANPLGNIPKEASIKNITLEGTVVRKEGNQITVDSNGVSQTFAATQEVQVFSRTDTRTPTTASGSAAIPENRAVQIILVPVNNNFQVSAVIVQ